MEREDAQPLVSIVVPLYNEEAILDENLKALAFFFDSIAGAGRWLFILVDNGSIDATPDKITSAIEQWPLSRTILLDAPNYGAALRAGLRSAQTRWVYLIDIEQWDLPFFAWSWANRERYDLFLGSKRSDPTLNFQAPYRKFLSCCLNGLLQTLFEFSGTDTHGPKLIDKSSLRSIAEVCCLDRGQYDTELVLRAVRAQKRIVEVPVVYRESRPHRNLMLKKIIWNLFALRRLVHVMKDVPHEGMIRFHRLTREEILGQVEIEPAVLVEGKSV
jgi:hypothetical protein